MSQMSQNVIVVGGGLAGISATCELLELGCSVTLIDKNPRPATGNSSKASTGIMCPLPNKQKEYGIVDNQADLRAPPGDLHTPAMLQQATDVTWLLETVRAEDNFSYMKTLGHPCARVLSNKNPHNSGQAVCASAVTLFNFLAQSPKLQILRGDRVTALVTKQLPGGGTEVCGVEHKNEADGNRVVNTVQGAVVLCTGGWTGNAEVVKANGCAAVCGPRVDGSGLSLAKLVGAQTTRLDEVTLTPYGCAYPGEKCEGLAEKFCLSGSLVGSGVAIFNKSGNLLSNLAGIAISDLSKARREEICAAMKRGGGPFTLVIANAPKGTEESLAWYVNNKFMEIYSDLEACSRVIGIPARVLSQALSVPVTGTGRSVYTVKITPAVYACCGGLQVDLEQKVQGTNGTNIEGLFAAGETAAGPSKKVYSMAGAPLLHCIVSGRAAAKSAAKAVFNGSPLPARQEMATLVKETFVEQVEASKPKEVEKPKETALEDLSKEDLIQMVKQLKESGAAPAAAAAPSGPVDDTKYFSLEEVAKHKVKSDAWLVVNGDVIDVTKFVDNHPGGEQAIMAYVGQDATSEWNQIHKPGLVEKVGLLNGAVKLGKLGSPGAPPAGGAAAPAAGGAPAAASGITLDEVAKHNKRDDAWLVVNGDVIDVTAFIDNHPGGVQAIMAMVGKDASSDWNAIHRPGLIEKVGLVSGAKIMGKAAGAPPPAAGGAAEEAFWDLPPPPDGEPPLFDLDGYPRINKLCVCVGKGWIGAIVHLAFNFVVNLGGTFLNTGNIRFKSERMGTIRSGLFLVFFFIAHSLDNQTTHLGRVQYNAMTYLMADRIQGECTGGFAWFDMYIGMAVLLHASVGIKRSWEINMGYTIGSGRWKWLLTGSAILAFLIQHLMDFRFATMFREVQIVDAHLPPNFLVRLAPTPPFVFFCADDNDKNAWIVKTRDIYSVEMEVFSKPHKVIQYVLFVCAVVMHLFYAWPKVVTSDALQIPKGHQNRVKYIGWAAAVLCGLLYMSVPISFYLGVMPSATGPVSEVCR